MFIKSLKITKLFDLFDYDIPLETPEGLRILTGPNGFGKTTILNIIYNILNESFLFFHELVFEEITLVLSDGTTINFTKSIDKNLNNQGNISRFTVTIVDKTGAERQVEAVGVKSVGDEDAEEYGEDQKKDAQKNQLIFQVPPFKVHLVKEQRLLKKVSNTKFSLSSNHLKKETYIIDTIEEYAKDLYGKINETLQLLLKKSQQLDSTFPQRLLKASLNLTEDDFNNRFEALKEKQHKLKQYGLSESEQEVPVFDESNAKVLSVYLDDIEAKLSVFDHLLKQLELFTTIINERRFIFKSVKIDRERGFTFQTNQGKALKLTDLSSGEQHEVVLLYELIFNSQEEPTLVLIDEPEISLHVTWQKAFLNDLLQIINQQKIQVIVATHSPQIIHDRWDLVYNLDKNIVPAVPITLPKSTLPPICS